MLQEVISYLIENPDVLQQVTNGTASLLGVTAEQQNSIIQVLSEGTFNPTSYWL